MCRIFIIIATCGNGCVAAGNTFFSTKPLCRKDLGRQGARSP